ncbi:DUF2158 domain-containing protein [Segnochrobactraceae bacterium EtOH-i3]
MMRAAQTRDGAMPCGIDSHRTRIEPHGGSRMTEKPFVVGDVVNLRSGGLPMTVARVDFTAGVVDLVWFDHFYIKREPSVPMAALDRCEPYWNGTEE